MSVPSNEGPADGAARRADGHEDLADVHAPAEGAQAHGATETAGGGPAPAGGGPAPADGGSGSADGVANPPGQAAGAPVGEYVFAGLTALVGIGVVAGAFSIPLPQSPEPLGPRTVPIAIGVALAAVSAWILVRLTRGVQGSAEGSEDVDPNARTDWHVVAIIVALVLIHAALIEPLGWPIAALILFAGAGFALGARPWWKPLVIGLVLAIVLQFVFAFLLDVSLPAGLLRNVVFLHG